jgi:methionyl-tRNA formyltransferase
VSRTVFLGTSGFAADVLQRLTASDHRPALVITPPDRPRGRGRRTLPTPAAAAAAELGLEMLKSPNVNEPGALEKIRAAEPEVAVVCAFGQLIREPLLSELEMLNVHPSLLPRWRGAAPIERAIMAGDPSTGISVMQVTAGLDSGPVALQQELAIGPRESFGELERRLAELGGELLVQALDALAAGRLELREQDEALATYAEKIDPSERHLDPTRAAGELDRVVRALTPHVGAYLELDDGERLGVREATPQQGELPAGEIAVEEGLLLGCGEGVLRLDVVQAAGGRSIGAGAYLRGHTPPARAL